MGKKQHQKDKLYLTTTEWKELYGGHKDVPSSSSRAAFRRLPFDHCSLSLQPFEAPYCTEEGIIFDLTSILPYLKKYGKNPVTGKKLDPKSLIKLNFFKNSEGQYHCPVTYKVFTPNSRIMAIRTTGNVFSYEAVDELNLKPKHFKDLLTDDPFVRKDIITLQDPDDLSKFNIASFDHVLHSVKVPEAADELSKDDPQYFLKYVNTETKQTLAQLQKDYKPEKAVTVPKAKADAINAATYSTGRVAHGFTSTVMDPVTEHEAAIVDEAVLKYERVKKKGYVRIVTNLGSINVELYCDQVPKTCENFIKLCKNGYYKNTVFHRLIKHFMVQGGDPTGTGHGGDSYFGSSFKDEFRPQYHHSGRGVLSMANSGPNTNKSQFFITFRSCQHLDRKHTIFGRVVGGMETLNAIEQTPTNDKDQPTFTIEILDTQVFVDPFEEAEELLKTERKRALVSSDSTDVAEVAVREVEHETYGTGVGKYIKPTTCSSSSLRSTEVTTRSSEEVPKKKKLGSTGFGNFSNW